MSEEQLTALLAKLKEDSGLREKLQAAADLDGFIALANDAGFNIRKADWLKHQAEQTLKLSDDDLEGIAGGGGAPVQETTGNRVWTCCAYPSHFSNCS